MINNRQAGRRRGRGGNNNGGQRPGGNPGRPDNGNRIDNRARGNANQLYEKYKNLAAEAQRQGDRVNTEYYWQFADHYFRVLSETRSRFEEQNQRRQREEPRDDQYDDGFDNDAEDYGDEGDPIRPGEQQGEVEQPRRERQPRETYARDNQQRDERPRRDRDDRPRREPREDRRPMRAEQPPVAAEDVQPVVTTEVAAAPQAEEEAPRRRGRPRRERPAEVQDAGEQTGFDADRLPPALSAAPEAEAVAEEKPRRRRVRAAAPVEPEAAAG
ncbi:MULTISPECIES: DUF4167 domain-containing protein [Sphingomonas]|uniref:DUF4167 domain-containing protein n=1 Tax=Sphingomonas zeae TaxID=1646122 RepID=A0A7Y6B4Y3_9SPHN|nr:MULTISPECIES: DUF4167 domain-containing protein [Sphingomonas]MBB4049140.1 hypothetical protein [Sphingomonas zeae]MDK8187110.1 DUF4167 domain-containing protein [Sphingomonas zeae]MDK8217467.1 DUF4167 domain-containing protein [Sphingomonas sp. UMB7805-LC452B]NUU46606.1 DUF4167 domain-containing protein [Sphingomonas zeae]